ncbi:hypothetical protein D9M68_467010 [compost metagenome]
MPAVFGNKSATVASARLQKVCAAVVGAGVCVTVIVAIAEFTSGQGMLDTTAR